MKRLGPSTFSQNAWNIIGAAALALGAMGCGNGGDGGTGGAGTGGATCDVPKLFMTKSCAIAGCHSANMPAAAFDMATPGWERLMIGKMPPGGGPTNTASMCAGMGKTYLVANSQPAMGLFLDKLSATPPCGVRMPNLPLMDLSAADLACVQEWANALTKP